MCSRIRNLGGYEAANILGCPEVVFWRKGQKDVCVWEASLLELYYGRKRDNFSEDIFHGQVSHEVFEFEVEHPR
ncbi:hypothetical protein BGZ58_004953, partial [Dissophora ornata]